MTIWPASVPVTVEFWPEREQRHREERLAQRRAQQRREELVGVADLGDRLMAAAVE